MNKQNQLLLYYQKIIISLIPEYWEMENTLLKIDIEGAEYEALRTI